MDFVCKRHDRPPKDKVNIVIEYFITISIGAEFIILIPDVASMAHISRISNCEPLLHNSLTIEEIIEKNTI